MVNYQQTLVKLNCSSKSLIHYEAVLVSNFVIRHRHGYEIP